MKKLLIVSLFVFVLATSFVLATYPDDFEDCPRSDSYRGVGFWKHQFTHLHTKSVNLSETELETLVGDVLIGPFDGWGVWTDVEPLLMAKQPTSEQRTQKKCLINLLEFPR